MFSGRPLWVRSLLLWALLAPAAALGRPTLNPPPLPPPAGAVVNVSTEAQLQAAVRELSSNTTIVIAPGTYRLTATLQLRGPYANVAIRGGHSRDEVVIVGPGMMQPSDAAPYGIWVGGDVRGVLIANLTIRDFSRHAIILNPGTHDPHIYNVRLVDAGQQFIKSNPDGAGGGVNSGIVEYSVIEYTTTAPSDYTNGIDVHSGANWTIRDNLFRNIVAPGGALAGPAVLMWNHSSNTVTERNRFLNCARGIAYGLQIAGFDHTGGVIRNNMFFRSRGQPGDVGIIVADSPNTQVLNNTVIVSGTYRAPIEYRFPGARNVVIQNNLVDGAIAARDGAVGTVSHNVTDAVSGMFVDGVTGDLHLVPSATAALDRGLPVAAVTDDWDGKARPIGSAYDIGASEVGVARRTTTAPAAAVTAAIPRMEPVRGSPPPAEGARLAQAADLIHLGAFRLPYGTFGGSSFGFAATGLAFNPARGSLFITGHEWHQMVSEIAIPAIRKSSKLAELATATMLQPFADATDGLLQTINPGDSNTKKIGGLLVYQNRLYLTGYSYYDGGGTQRLSHFASSLDLGVKGDVRGPFRVGAAGAGLVSGYFGLIPPAWQAALGGAVMNGQCCIPIISRTSYGPALFTIDPAQVGTIDPAPARPLVYYTGAHPLLQPGSAGDGLTNTSTVFNGTTEVRGVVFPEGTASVLFFGRHGVGEFCYGPGTSDKTKAGKPATDVGNTHDVWCYDPTDDSKGTHGYPYAHYVWAYSAFDLAAVAAGKKEPWELQPHATWSLTLPASTYGATHINGAAYDPATNRIFLSQAFADGDQPLIHVFTVRPPARVMSK